jgi:hypothetical protein
MPIRVVADENHPAASIEIPLEKPLPDYGLEQIERPTPREVDAILASGDFRELMDDARGVLMDLLAHPPHQSGAGSVDFHFGHEAPAFELKQLTGAICPGDDEVYRPALWIVLQDSHAQPRTALAHTQQECVRAIAAELVKRLRLA